MEKIEYKCGTKVRFNSKHGESAHNGQIAMVTILGNNSDESGIAHGIRFEDGNEIWAYPQELTPIKK